MFLLDNSFGGGAQSPPSFENNCFYLKIMFFKNLSASNRTNWKIFENSLFSFDKKTKKKL